MGDCRGMGTPSEMISQHIHQLHEYNEIKDVGQVILGKVWRILLILPFFTLVRGNEGLVVLRCYFVLVPGSGVQMPSSLSFVLT